MPRPPGPPPGAPPGAPPLPKPTIAARPTAPEPSERAAAVTAFVPAAVRVRRDEVAAPRRPRPPPQGAGASGGGGFGLVVAARDAPAAAPKPADPLADFMASVKDLGAFD